MKRLSSLDYLRGLSAFGIMVFHYTMWLTGLITTNTFLGKVGIYGVAVFYVLSGLTLFHVYYDKMGSPSKSGLIDFGIKRIFRIFPLLWLLSIASLLIRPDKFSTESILLNFSGLFSVINWSDTIVYGAWSIGNELTFYLFFPVFLFFSKRSSLLFSLISLIVFTVYVWFAFIKMDKAIIAGDAWVTYTNPLNQVFLFLGGYIIGLLTSKINVSKLITLPVLLVAFAVFIFLPVSGDATHLMTGWYRLIFTLICFAVCFSFYKTNFNLPLPLHRIFEKLGEISYCLYLVHRLTYEILAGYLKNYYSLLPLPLKMITGFSFSLLAAYFIYTLFEKYFMKLGKKVSAGLNSGR